ncbi:B12-binding domain-containing radical SAM protein [Blautia sp.]|uniref:B12-binding domain-containing radical SAM protein n=1 Tax=Blautia sp. TaxID=1955243 RepID=UPI002E765EAE|nr:B12-binding domain-containing radical SAM protein [Blautia sp.]MEE0810102.1 B12-binding domain-containing radical SAM protein [Blautia sp.]
MKVLLTAVNAKYIHSNLAIYSMKAYAEQKGCPGAEIQLAEYTINQQQDGILRGIYEKKPDLLCFSCYIWNISFVRELIRDVKKILPKTRIWVGGPEVSYDAEDFLKEMPQVTGVICGEGEETFAEVVRTYAQWEKQEQEPGKLADVPGIVYRDGEKLVFTGNRDILNMDELVFPYENLSLFEHKIIYYESSRGCPFSCSYCLSSIDKKLRFRSVSLVKKELQFFLDHQVPQVKFVDRTFNCKKEHAMEIWKYIKEHDNGITNFHFEIAADLLTEEEIGLIAAMRPGLIQLEIGVQSTNERTLQEIRRKTSFQEICKKVRAVAEGENVHQHLDLIAGLPYEDYKSFQKSFCDVYALRPQQLQLGFLKVLKGAYMEEMADAYGCVYKSKEPYEVLKTKWLTYGEISRLKGIEEMTEVYYNSGQFFYTLEALVKEFPDAFTMYEELADFYKRKGYFAVSHARISRYEILREFLQEKGIQYLEFYDQLMVLDLYARENLKTRPSWAMDLKPYKRQIQTFYAKEEEQPEILKDYQGYQARQMEKMTHLEVFTYNVLEGKPEKGCYPVVFDYKKRNPLTYQGGISRVSFFTEEEA